MCVSFFLSYILSGSKNVQLMMMKPVSRRNNLKLRQLYNIESGRHNVENKCQIHLPDT